MGLRLIATED